MRADYVIIGSGSAGSVMANRLSDSGKLSVIVIEFGGKDTSPLIQMPAALSYPMNMSKFDWGYKTEPEPHLNNRILATPRGKVMGGSSSINGMVYVRGHACDFDFWADSGAIGWNYANVLPYFKRMENWSSSEREEDFNWRGSNGPLHISLGDSKNPLFKAFIEAGIQAGFEATNDYNGEKQEGFGVMEQTIFKGRRWSASNAYLKPALKKDNVQLLRAFARRIIFEDNEAVAVEVSQGKRIFQVKANKEIILAASAINSPKILMHSGIGPSDHLKEHGIKIISNRPGVGSNLQDHLEVYLQQECLRPISLNKHWNIVSKVLIGLQWIFTKKGLGASNQFESAAFVRSAPGIKYPDIQFHFLPIAIRYDGKAASSGHGFQAHVGPMRSESRGTVRLRSNSVLDSPIIRFNYMSSDRDWVNFRHCIRLTREIFSQNALKDYAGIELSPGANVKSDEEIDTFVQENVESAYHPCGTCKMGSENDVNSVVNAKCEVIGVRRLRVVDSSIFPRITNGNINGPTIMVGEKASDIILNIDPLPALNPEPWINSRWQSSDR